jgi:hypothetical protein
MDSLVIALREDGGTLAMLEEYVKPESASTRLFTGDSRPERINIAWWQNPSL